MFWDMILKDFPNIAIYGYTANNIKSKLEKSRSIASTISVLHSLHKERFSIRFSNDLENPFSANSFDVVKPVKGKSILCPVQENKTPDCGACGLCWNSPDKQIICITN